MGRSELHKLLEEKYKAKELLFAKCWPHVKTTHPLLIIFATPNTAASNQKELLFQVLEGLLVLPMQVIVVSDTEPPDHGTHPSGKITWVTSENGRNQSKIDHLLLASDLAVVFDAHQETFKKLFARGVIPIGLEKSPLIADYHPNEETGNSFTFDSLNPWSIFKAIVRANETYRFPFDWQHIIREMLKVR